MRHFLALRATGAPQTGQFCPASANGDTEAAESTRDLRRREDGNSRPHMRHFLARRATGAPQTGQVRFALTTMPAITALILLLRVLGGGSSAPHIKQVCADRATFVPQSGQNRCRGFRKDRSLSIILCPPAPIHWRCPASLPAQWQCARSTRFPNPPPLLLRRPD